MEPGTAKILSNAQSKYMIADTSCFLLEIGTSVLVARLITKPHGLTIDWQHLYPYQFGFVYKSFV